MAPDEKKCPQCAETVKEDAKVCRFCGFQFQPQAVRRTRTRMPSGCLVVIIAIVVIVGLMRLHWPENGSPDVASNASSTNTAAESPEDSRRTGLAFAAGQQLAATARNPDSLVIEQAIASDDGHLLCVRYRAQNGFGGMNRETAAWYDGTPHLDAAYWNKHCTKPMRDVTFVVEEGAKH